jgi:hypothetical protein
MIALRKHRSNIRHAGTVRSCSRLRWRCIRSSSTFLPQDKCTICPYKRMAEDRPRLAWVCGMDDAGARSNPCVAVVSSCWGWLHCSQFDLALLVSCWSYEKPTRRNCYCAEKQKCPRGECWTKCRTKNSLNWIHRNSCCENCLNLKHCLNSRIRPNSRLHRSWIHHQRSVARMRMEEIRRGLLEPSWRAAQSTSH